MLLNPSYIIGIKSIKRQPRRGLSLTAGKFPVANGLCPTRVRGFLFYFTFQTSVRGVWYSPMEARWMLRTFSLLTRLVVS